MWLTWRLIIWIPGRDFENKKVLLIDWYVAEALKARFKLRINYVRQYLVPLLKAIKSPLEKDVYINQAALRLGLDNLSQKEIDSYISEHKEGKRGCLRD